MRKRQQPAVANPRQSGKGRLSPLLFLRNFSQFISHPWNPRHLLQSWWPAWPPFGKLPNSGQAGVANLAKDELQAARARTKREIRQKESVRKRGALTDGPSCGQRQTGTGVVTARCEGRVELRRERTWWQRTWALLRRICWWWRTGEMYTGHSTR